MSGGAGPEHRLERLIFFSDAVFAIAITLLVIELHVPHVEPGAGDAAFINALLRMIPNFLGFIVSFFVIGAFWAGHHRAFSCAAHWSDGLLGPNIVMLFTIAAMPFFTAYASAYNDVRVPTVAYCGWLLLTALCNLRLQRLATAPPVVDATMPAARLTAVRQRGLSTVLGAATGLIVALFANHPLLGQVALLTIPMWRLVLGRIGS
ncbi:TMEM175 family protein [Sphingomonas sp.]|uniref:TMEM175 family protein n=1 Tax=Sphingomonas sp. TaxID=28214 RepID=UPI001D591879|nr:TMEM175 family protein [Sphingomonas sp.]MBX9795317.1 DUF1211 domain-containing protein [Sphingomonas sp.]